MAYLKPMRGKYYTIISIWDGIKQSSKTIPLNTDSKTAARQRHAVVEKHEQDIKDGLEYIFPWQNNGGNTQVKLFTLTDAIKLFIKHKTDIQRVRIKTIQCYNESFKSFTEYVGDINIKMITLNHIDIFIQFLQIYKKQDGSPLSINTINNRIRNIRTLIIWLDERDMINKAPRIRELKVDKSPPKYISEVDFKKVLEKDLGHPRFKMMFKLCWDTGMRLSEPFIGVINGGWYDIPADKSKNHEARSITINQEHRDAISKIQSIWQQHPTEDAIKWYSKKFKKALIEIGILNRHFHCIRHSYGARRILETNGNIYQVRDEMGHSSVIITERYAKLDRKRIEYDFPSINKTSKMDIMDTLSMDTGLISGRINREELN